MAVAERGEQIGCAPWLSGSHFTGAHSSRIMTFVLATPSSGRVWMSTDPLGSLGTFSGEYMLAYSAHTDSAGGVDFGDGYSSPPSPTSMFLWSTVNSYKNSAFINNAPPPATPARFIYGAQGMLLSDAMTRSVTAPITATSLATDPPKLFIIDYDENVKTLAKNQIGDIRVRRNTPVSPVACNCATIRSSSSRTIS